MSHTIGVGVLLNLLGASLLVLLGVLVWRTGPRRASTRFAAGLLATWGAAHVGFNMRRVAHESPLVVLVPSAVLFLVAGVCLVGLAVTVVAREDRWRVAPVAAALGVLAVLWTSFGMWGEFGDAWGLGSPAETARESAVFAFFLFWTVIWAVLWYWAVQAGSAGTASRTGLALPSAALFVYAAYTAGEYSVWGVGFTMREGIVILLAAVGNTGLWFRVALRRGDRGAAAVGLLGLLAVLGGMVATVTLGYERAEQGGPGLARVAAALVLGYAIVRHQLFGIDLKLKWTIKQSTVAAIFVTVFFVASELASSLLSERMGTVAGIFTAGVLVFAIVPLQQFAQRVADKAMPGVKAPSDMSDDERRQAYLEAARQAWADGSLDKSERAMLDRLREVLRINEAEAHRIERDAAA